MTYESYAINKVEQNMPPLKCITKLSVISVLPEFHSNSTEVSRERETKGQIHEPTESMNIIYFNYSLLLLT